MDFYHPIFGSFEPEEVSTAGDADLYADRMIAFLQAVISDDDAAAESLERHFAGLRQLPIRALAADASVDTCTTPLAPDEWPDEEGRIWNVRVRPRPAETAVPLALIDQDSYSAEVDPQPVEKKRLPVSRDASRYDAAFTALRNAEADFRDAMAELGPADPKTIQASSVVASAKANFAREGKRSKTDIARLHDAVDAHRKTPAGREARNANRRKRAAPNADRTSMTDDERIEHDRKKAREKKRAQRAARRPNAVAS